jgi:hypothetical protein
MTITTKLLKPFLLKLIERNKREKKKPKRVVCQCLFQFFFYPLQQFYIVGLMSHDTFFVRNTGLI